MKHDLDHLPADWAARLASVLEPIHPEPDRAVSLRTSIMKRAQAQKSSDGHLTLRSQERRWHTLAPGVDMQMLRRASDTTSYLLRIAAGMSVPAHDHATDEECLVLEGDVWLGDTHAFAGDYHLAHRGIPHGVIHTDTGCLLFLNGPKPEAASHFA